MDFPHVLNPPTDFYFDLGFLVTIRFRPSFTYGIDLFLDTDGLRSFTDLFGGWQIVNMVRGCLRSDIFIMRLLSLGDNLNRLFLIHLFIFITPIDC